MAALIHQCPHPDCLADRMSFNVHALTYASGRKKNQIRNFAHVTCKACGQPSALEISDAGGTGQLMPGFENYPVTLEYLGWHVVRIWPEIPLPRMPDHLPDQVARAFLSAERNFSQPGMEDASAASYGRALDIGTKLFATDLAKPLLAERIRKLAEQRRITSDLADWANAIRFIRNYALHEIDGVNHDELVAIRGFTETVLTYLFTLPGMLKERQALTKQSP